MFMNTIRIIFHISDLSIVVANKAFNLFLDFFLRLVSVTARLYSV